MIKLFENIKKIHFTLIIIFFFLLSFTGCGNESDQAETGSVNLKITITNPDTPTKALINCNTTGVSIITATIQNFSGNELVSGGPWQCSAGRGTLPGVPVGNNYTVIVNARSEAGTLIYRGTTQGISVSGGSNTPVGVDLLSVDSGNDSDNDGVMDAGDNCPNTPSNETADANGCSSSQKDTDGDGIIDVNDDCPNTQTGEAVDASGCSDSQKDTDGDGIVDVNDDCPNTQTGEAVNANGCSDSQVFDPNDNISNTRGMVFNKIPSGTFTMGSPTSEPGRNPSEIQHEVTITNAYYMQTTEVTQGQWESVMGTTSWAGSGVQVDPNNPAVNVSWDDIQIFITTINNLNDGTYRLPTEAEWEYAARGGSSTAYHYGDDAGLLGDYAWYYDNANYIGESYAHGVGVKTANHYGLHDMHGNVWEWVEDRYDVFTSEDVTDPVGPSTGSSRVLRGSSWESEARYCRSAMRSGNSPGYRIYTNGFRLSRTP